MMYRVVFARNVGCYQGGDKSRVYSSLKEAIKAATRHGYERIYVSNVSAEEGYTLEDLETWL